MFTPKKTIPKLAVAMLALTGCGGDGNNGTGGSGGSGASGGTGGNGGNGLSSSLQAFCMKIVDCYQEIYPDYTVQDCVNFYNNGYLANYNLDANCEGALVSYFNCGTGLTCDEIMANSNSCDDEFDAIFDICEPVMP